MAKNVERLQAREAKELIRREKQLGARSNKFYLIYLFMILSLIYITDEIASTISIQFQATIVTLRPNLSDTKPEINVNSALPTGYRNKARVISSSVISADFAMTVLYVAVPNEAR